MFAFCILTFVAVSKTMVTKQLFDDVSLPLAYSTLSCIVTFVVLLPFGLYTKCNHLCVDGILFVSFMMAVDIALANIALSILSIPLQQCIKASGPAMTIIIESIKQKEVHHPLLYGIVLIICLCPCLIYKVDEYKDVGGICAMCLSVLFGSLKNVFAHSIISHTTNGLDVLPFTFCTEALISILLMPCAFVTGEINAMLNLDATLYPALLFTALFGGVRILSQIYFLKHTSPTSLALSNVCVQLFTILVSFALYGMYGIDGWAWTGIWTSLICSALYAYIKLKNPFPEYPKEWRDVLHRWRGYPQYVSLTPSVVL